MKTTFILAVFLASISVLACAPAESRSPITKEMISVAGGTFVMGKNEPAGSRFNNINPPHKVTLNSFQMAKFLVTVAEWKVFIQEAKLPFTWNWTNDLPAGKSFKDLIPTDECPAQGLTWYYAVSYCNWLSIREGLTPVYEIGVLNREADQPKVTWNKQASGYRLPTEAEWEYAARGGLKSLGYEYAGSNSPDEVSLSNQTKSYPVGKMKPNELGLYDMTGDVAVWCWDWFDARAGFWLPEKNPSVDLVEGVRQPNEDHPDAANPEVMKVIRGNMWQAQPVWVYHRDHYPANAIGWVGIRLVRNGE